MRAISKAHHVISLAIEKNKAEDSDYDCELICIEPYEAHWLEELGIQVIRDRLEHVPLDIFKQLEATDTADQKRVMTPAMAMNVGANWLVIGRPIYAAENPRQAAEDILSSLSDNH